jgi:hypothetical protein
MYEVRQVLDWAIRNRALALDSHTFVFERRVLYTTIFVIVQAWPAQVYSHLKCRIVSVLNCPNIGVDLNSSGKTV